MKISTQNKRTDKQAIFSGISIFSLSLFVAASAVYMYSPVAESHADTTGNSIVNLSVNSIISLSLNSNTVAMNADMNSFTHQSVTASVSSNSQFGYTLAIEDGDSDSSMTHTSSSITDKITSSFSGGKTSGEMDDNTWGYSISNSTYYKIPVAGSPVALKRTNAPLEAETDDTVVDFGVKVGNITSGSYQDTVTLSAYVNGVDGTPSDGTSVGDPDDDPDDEYGNDFSGEMQTFDCSEISIGQSGTLVDNRDQNTYTVAKLNDGRCWMTQNLRLIGGIQLTPEDSDVLSSYTIPISVWASTNDSGRFLDSGNHEYGMYYNFVAASAGTVTESTPTTTNADYSICPKGWGIPHSNEWTAMYSAESIDSSEAGLLAATTGPARLVYSGFNGVSGVYSEDNYGEWWSSDGYKYSSIYRNSAYISKDDALVNPKHSADRKYGMTLRCIAD